MTTQAILSNRRAESVIITLRRNGLDVTDFALELDEHGDVVDWGVLTGLVEHHWLDANLAGLREQIEFAL